MSQEHYLKQAELLWNVRQSMPVNLNIYNSFDRYIFRLKKKAQVLCFSNRSSTIKLISNKDLLKVLIHPTKSFIQLLCIECSTFQLFCWVLGVQG